MARKKRSKTPIWVIEYLDNIKKLRKIAEDNEIYACGQDKLLELKKTGKGNCVAMSKLFRQILKKHNVDRAQRLEIGVMDRREKFTHEVTIVYEGLMKIWYQSNEELLCFKTFHELIKFAEKEMGWTYKGFMIISKAWLSWC